MHLHLLNILSVVILSNVCTRRIGAANCGCKTVRPCYKEMVETLRDHDEVTCIEDASMGGSTLTVYLAAITQFCGNITTVFHEMATYGGRHLYEVVISDTKGDDPDDERPVIVIDAGQEAGSESVGLALYVIQQLVMCKENHDMIRKVRWVILPSTNPDGQEYAGYQRMKWRKNLRPSEDDLSYGVDISRNFEGDWKSCPIVSTGFSQIYPGLAAGSENETIFIQNVFSKYRKTIQAYLSLREDGHSISYPYGFDSTGPPALTQFQKATGAIAAKVNQRAGSVHLFTNQSIYEINGKARCGHSVDYAFQYLNVLHSYEMRVFLGTDNRIISKFQTLPRGYNAALRNGYYSGIKELYNIVLKDKMAKHY